MLVRAFQFLDTVQSFFFSSISSSALLKAYQNNKIDFFKVVLPFASDL